MILYVLHQAFGQSFKSSHSSLLFPQPVSLALEVIL